MPDNQILYSTHEELVIMVRSKPRPKREKKEETTEEFVKSLKKQADKHTGLKRRVGQHHR